MTRLILSAGHLIFDYKKKQTLRFPTNRIRVYSERNWSPRQNLRFFDFYCYNIVMSVILLAYATKCLLLYANRRTGIVDSGHSVTSYIAVAWRKLRIFTTASPDIRNCKVGTRETRSDNKVTNSSRYVLL